MSRTAVASKRRLAAVALFVVIVGLDVAYYWLAKDLHGQPPLRFSSSIDWSSAVGSLWVALVGLVLSWVRPRHPVGWLLGAVALCLVVNLAGAAYGAHDAVFPETGLPFGREVLVLSAPWWIPSLFVPVTYLLVRYPAGSIQTRWGRRFDRSSVAGLVLIFLVYVSTPEAATDVVRNGEPLFDLPDWPLVWLAIGVLTGGLCLFGLFGTVGEAVYRAVKAPRADRMALLWLLVIAVFAAILIFFGSSEILGSVAFAGIPLGIAVGVLRYGAMGIEVVVNRTLIVAGLSAFITVSYVAIVVGLGALLGGGDGTNLGLSLAATAFVAVAFQPVRRFLQRLANRVVFGRRATPYDVLSRFATNVGAAEASPERLVGVAELMADGTGARPARVWLRVGGELRPAAAWPADDEDSRPAPVAVDDLAALPGADVTVPVQEGADLLGLLTIAKPRGERVTEVDVDLVERLGSASAVLLRNLRLDAELQQRLDEIKASSRRLVTAQDDARRRIEAELGGGTRAQLTELGEKLTTLAGELNAAEAPQTVQMLNQLAASTQDALGTLDGLAAGIYPPLLSADGLVAALAEQAERAAVPVELDTVGIERFPAEVEAAVYFSVLEALQNVAKYAGPAARARVRLVHESGELTFEVSDNGAGFDPATVTLGTGVQGITDRLNTVGGTASITSAPGRGTTVAGKVPHLAAARQ